MLFDFVTSLNRPQKRVVLLLLEACTICAAYFASRALIAGLGFFSGEGDRLWVDLGVILLTGVATLVATGLYRAQLKTYELQSMWTSATVAFAMVLAGLLVNTVMPGISTASGVIVVFGMIYLILIVSLRLVLREALLAIYRHGTPQTRVMIYGAGQTGQQLAAALKRDRAVITAGFVDDNRAIQGVTIMGHRVESPARLDALVEKRRIDRIVLAMPSVSRAVQAQIAHRLRDVRCEVHVMSSFAELLAQGRSAQPTQTVDLKTLLGRERLETELPGVNHSYKGLRILISGAGGTIGSELCRQLVDSKPASLVLLDHSEAALYKIDRELTEAAPELKIVPVLGSVCEAGLVKRVLNEQEIDLVLHAAAYKHVPMVEANPVEGIRNNVMGTKVLADAARNAGVERFILISSDKAVRPTSVMGASKRLAELVVQDIANRSKTTRFSMVRFGNVLGSSGSVIPLFEDQIRRGGPVTVTHHDVTRYFMTVSEAVHLVLLAGTFTRGGDVFVLDMGKPVPIRKLARQMIEGAGFTVRDEENPEGDIEIRITGLRPGEKLHEELLIGSDMLTTPHPKILRAQEEFLSEIETAKAIQSLRRAIEARDTETVRSVFATWVEAQRAVGVAVINE